MQFERGAGMLEPCCVLILRIGLGEGWIEEAYAVHAVWMQVESDVNLHPYTLTCIHTRCMDAV